MLEYIDWFKGFPKEIATLLIAMSPIGELRASIPIALSVYKLSWISAFLWSLIGNIFIVVLILWLLEPISKFLIRHFRIFDRFFKWLFARTRRKYTARVERWGAVALVSFVAIPLPGTGGWTGALVAFVFGIPFRKALPLIIIGILIAGVIVTILSLSGISFFDGLGRM